MIRSFGAAAALAFVVTLPLSAGGCDDSRGRAAEELAQRQEPPVRTGNVGEVMAAERVMPKLPTPNERLMLAIRNGDREAAEQWLAKGAALDPASPVLVAATRGTGDVEFLRWLVGLGAGVDTADPAGRTPLSWAAGTGSEKKLTYLLERGADTGSVDQLGRTPLHYGVFSGQDAVVTRLLDATAAIDAQDSLGSTPLMYACSKNRPSTIQLLRDRGANESLRDKLGRSAAERAHGDPNPCAP